MILCGDETHGNEYEQEGITDFLRVLAIYAMKNPNFLIRLHSGESQDDKKGISYALTIIKEEFANLTKYPRIRIGHGIHGINEESAKLIKELGAQVDLNLPSNVKLGYISPDPEKDKDVIEAVRLLHKYQIPTFIGTDGFGLYRSDPIESMKMAVRVGLDVQGVIKNEKEYIEQQKIFEEKVDKRETKISRLSCDKDQFSKERLTILLKNQGIKVILNQGTAKYRDRVPIIIAGGSLKTGSDMDFKQYRDISIALQTLVNVIDIKKCYFVTGGTNCGPESVFYDVKQNGKRDIDSLAVMPSYVGMLNKSALNDYNHIKFGTKEDRAFDDAIVVVADTWGKFAEPLIRAANNNINEKKGTRHGENGFAIFIGGGGVVTQEILLACMGKKESHIEPIQCFCYDGLDASAKAIEDFKGQNNMKAFSNAEMLIRQIYSVYGKEFFAQGFDIDELTAYINKSKRMIKPAHEIMAEKLIDDEECNDIQLMAIKNVIEQYDGSGKFDEEINKVFKLIGKNNDNKQLKLFIRTYSEYLNRNNNELPIDFTENMSISEVIERNDKRFKDVLDQTRGKEEYGNR